MVELTPELLAIRQEWQGCKKREEQDRVYAEYFAPLFAPLFAQLPLYRASSSLARPRALISVLGLSWQPVALMAAWIKPEKMLILGTAESFKCKAAALPVLDIIPKIAGLSPSMIEHFEVPDDGELEIYQQIGDFIKRHRLSPREVAVDPTGGKKSMSVSAGLVGFLTGSLLVYVDYGEYHDRIPMAGSEYPRLLSNPLEHFGSLEIRRICAAFKRGDYKEAEDLATDLENKLYEQRPAQAYRLLARSYGAWNDFNFETARDGLNDLSALVEDHGRKARWEWARPIELSLRSHLPLIEKLAAIAQGSAAMKTIEEGMPMVLNHLAAAQRALRQGRLGIAILLAYATLERYVDLCLLCEFGLDDERPDYEQIASRLVLEDYHRKGRLLFDKYEPRPMSGPLMLGNGLQLLSALAPGRMPECELKPLRGLMQDRNKSPYEHGLSIKALKAESVERNIALVKKIIALSMTGKSIEDELALFAFPALED
jgi:CRISPR-associated protein (TIGR02710 family)